MVKRHVEIVKIEKDRTKRYRRSNVIELTKTLEWYLDFERKLISVYCQLLSTTQQYFS